MRLTSFPEGYRALVWGASGGIGRAFVEHLDSDPGCAGIAAVSRRGTGDRGKIRSLTYDPDDMSSIEAAAESAAAQGRPSLVICAIGVLHGQGYGPEKALRQIEAEAFETVLRINTVLPALIARASVPHLAKGRAVFSALSARVGSISDNRLGGWHSYRASKAALNMILRGVAIELARKNKEAVVAGIHPGTVNTALSEPFQGNVPEGKLFTPQHSTEMMLGVLDGLTPEQSGDLFDYAGERIGF